MSNNTSKVLEEVAKERAYQDSKWGEPFDDKNSPYNWMGYISHYGGRNLCGNPDDVLQKRFRIDMIKVAALAVAAVESIDRQCGS